MHRTQTLALLLAAGLLCSGCASGAISSNYRPVEDLMLIQTIGVDRAPEGVCLSASTGRAGENKPPQRMTQTGETVLAALDRLQDRTPNAELFYAQTSYLLLGEEAAAAGELTPLLDFIARNPDMRLSAPLFLVRGAAAQQAVMDTGDDRTDVTEALSALQKDTALSGASHAFSCADIARALAGSGCAAVGAVACVRTSAASRPRRHVGQVCSSAWSTTATSQYATATAAPSCSRSTRAGQPSVRSGTAAHLRAWT